MKRIRNAVTDLKFTSGAVKLATLAGDKGLRIETVEGSLSNLAAEFLHVALPGAGEERKRQSWGFDDLTESNIRYAALNARLRLMLYGSR